MQRCGPPYLSEIKEILLIKDESKVLHKSYRCDEEQGSVLIDLDEMELEAFYRTIEEFITSHYKSLVRA